MVVERLIMQPCSHSMGTNQFSKMQTYWLAQQQVERLRGQMNGESDALRHRQLAILLSEQERKLATLT
jgi:hypothetical protein